ncbi:mono/diheme cytochrome c family protein [Ensifer sp. 4252]
MPFIRAERLKNAVVVAFFLLSSKEGAAADLARGHSIAVRWCSECHMVAPGQGHGSDAVPTFAEIKASDRLDEAQLTAFLSAPEHSRMPNLSLTRAEIADLVAYIKAQRKDGRNSGD